MNLRLFSLFFTLFITILTEATVVEDPAYLQKTPASTRIRGSGEQIPDGGAGVYLYGNVDGHLCLLLGGEEKGAKGEIYCPLAGSSQFKEDGTAESFERTARRELEEESATLYSLSAHDLKRGDFYFQENKTGGQYLLVFLRTDQTWQTEDLKKAQAKLRAQGKESGYFEKKNLKWIPFTVFLEKTRGTGHLVYEGRVLPLQKAFAETCDEPNFRSLMERILKRDSDVKKAA